MVKHGFKTVDTLSDEYELLALSFDAAVLSFIDAAKRQSIDNNDLTIYYGLQCPYIPNFIKEVESYCKAKGLKLDLIKVDTLETVKSMPCVFNNWAVFYNEKFVTVHLLNEGYLKKTIDDEK